MAYTGVDFYNDLQIRTNQGSAAAFLSTDRANYFAKQAIISLVQDNYRSITEQSSVDEISPLIQTNKTFVPLQNQLLLKPLSVVSGVAVYDVGDFLTTLTITFNRPHLISVGGQAALMTPNGLTGTGNVSYWQSLVGEAYTAVDEYTLEIIRFGDETATITGGEYYVIGTNDAISANYNVYDYYNYLSCKLEYTENLGLDILGVDNKLGQFVITIGANNNIRTGEYLDFTSFGGLTIGKKYVKKIAYNKIKLYNDEKLKTQYVNANTYTSGGVITRTSNLRTAFPYPSDLKNDVYPPTPRYPLFETNENRLAIYPNEGITQTKYVLDYIKRFYEIDVTNNVTDIYYYYNALFCTKILERSAQLFYAMVSSGEDIQIENVIGGNLWSKTR